ncbi:hypothetical protein Scep_003856 [Stephania cephalantha]|uniref:Uncharacterized protein n=1 Tax=Stephania cephalantha TaxID=152367 RepID=A0AAP0PUT2_9MAGN
MLVATESAISGHRPSKNSSGSKGGNLYGLHKVRRNEDPFDSCISNSCSATMIQESASSEEEVPLLSFEDNPLVEVCMAMA